MKYCMNLGEIPYNIYRATTKGCPNTPFPFIYNELDGTFTIMQKNGVQGSELAQSVKKDTQSMTSPKWFSVDKGNI